MLASELALHSLCIRFTPSRFLQRPGFHDRFLLQIGPRMKPDTVLNLTKKFEPRTSSRYANVEWAKAKGGFPPSGTPIASEPLCAGGA